MNDLKLEKDLVILQSPLSTDKEVIESLANRLHEKEYVKDSFIQAVLDREKVFPTGLQIGEINVAIPHAEPEHVNQACIGICSLKEPVLFSRMDDDSQKVPVKLVLMLALSEAHSHMEVLSRIIRSISDEKFVKELSEAPDSARAVQLLKARMEAGN